MYVYQQYHRYFAQVADGLESVAAVELEGLGARDIKPTYRGMYFTADDAVLYRITYCARLITRVLAPFITFDCHSTKYLYKTARTLPWMELMGLEQTFCITATVAHSKINHSQYAAQCLKDAIVDTFRDHCGERPSVERINPDVRFNLHIYEDRATIALDLSGGSLHRRGYRVESVEAPMQETVAAGIIALSGWDGTTPLYDPLCGSGTLLAEAGMYACGIPAQRLRTTFGLPFLPEYDAALWKRVRAEADGAVRELPRGLVCGGDCDGQAVAAARTNCQALGLRPRIVRQRFEDIPELTNTTIVTNPPYGLRLNRDQDMKSFMRNFGDFLKKRCTGSTAWIYFGRRELIKSVGLRPAAKIPLKNGQLDGRLVKFELY